MTGTIEMRAAADGPRTAPQLAGGDFSALFADLHRRVDGEIEAWLAAKRRGAASAGLPSDLELIDGIAQLIGGGGKRLRPALVYFSYRALGGSEEDAVLPLALATEFLHTYLLIHDDIMDHAEVRRGLPAAHARFRDAHRAHAWRGDAGEFGAAVGILLGDLAHTWAAELFSAVPVDGPRAGELARCFSTMCQEVIGGQYLELQVASRRESEQAGEEELLTVLRLKSGRYTAERPIQLGAILAGASPAALAGLGRFGNAVGEAFQLQDDLLGMFGDPQTVGKPVGADLTEGKFTFLIYHALAAASAEQRAALTAALGRPGLPHEEVDRVHRILEDTGARTKVEAMVDERLQAARAALADLELQEPGRAFFAGLVDYLKERRD